MADSLAIVAKTHVTSTVRLKFWPWEVFLYHFQLGFGPIQIIVHIHLIAPTTCCRGGSTETSVEPQEAARDVHPAGGFLSPAATRTTSCPGLEMVLTGVCAAL
jgi:hypothetical protein